MVERSGALSVVIFTPKLTDGIIIKGAVISPCTYIVMSFVMHNVEVPIFLGTTLEL